MIKFITMKNTVFTNFTNRLKYFSLGIFLLLGFFVKGQAVKIETVSPKVFQEKMKQTSGILIDVRTPGEYKKGHLSNARLLNIFDDNFELELDKLDKKKVYYIYCASGGRSSETLELMQKKGFKQVMELDGGITRWQREGLPVVQ